MYILYYIICAEDKVMIYMKQFFIFLRINMVYTNKHL